MAPGYELDAVQRKQVEEHDDPESYAKILERRMNDVRDDAVRYLSKAAPDLGITAADITNHDAMAGIRVFKYGGIHGDDEGQLDAMGPIVLMRIARRTADVDPVTWAFRRFLGRDPKALGMNHYTAELANGRPVWEIMREIELSDEARAR